jgi:N,N'-diacetylbacillosaminyl-diphospho-undecaprenol alpha-1,3-N-acetylgalactosaminyltransferase
MMKIAIVCPNDFTVVTFCGSLVRLLQDNGVNSVYAVCDVHSEQPGESFATIMKSWGVRHLPVTFYRFLSARKDVTYTWSLYRILRREKFDIVINIATKANVYGSIAARLAGTRRIVCSVWGLGVTFGDHRGLKARALRGVVTSLYRIGFLASSRVWFTNEADYLLFVSKKVVSPAKAFLTKNYVNTDVYAQASVTSEQVLALRQEFRLQHDDKVVVMVARMSWAKGVREFVEAAGLLRDDLPMLKFILIGPKDDGSSDSVPESYLRQHEAAGNFIWTGFRRDVQTFYAASVLAVLPSYYREGGFPRGLTEAMCMGKPVITTDSVHCRATVEHGKNGYHVPIKDSKALAYAIKEIVTDEDKMERFGRYSRAKAVNEFDENKIALEVVREIL